MNDATNNPVRRARLKSGLTQIDLALRARVSLSTVRLAERGVFTTHTLAAFAAVLQVSVDELRGRQGGAQ